MNIINYLRQFRKRAVQILPPPEGPLVLNVFTTNRCNFSCSYCSRNIDDNLPGNMHKYNDKCDFNSDDFKTLLSKYPSILEVCFIGIGEPFLLPNLIEMGKYAKSCGKKTAVITNGTLIPDNINDLEEAFDIISVSIHGFTTEELAKTAGVSNDVFNKLIENIRKFSNSNKYADKTRRVRSAGCSKIDFRASVVLNRSNYKRALNALQFAEKYGIEKLEFHNYLPYGLNDADECIYDDDIEIINFLRNLQSSKVNITLPTLIKRDISKLQWNCLSFFRVLRVDGLGQVSGCNCIMVPKKENGNWKDDPDVWKNKYFTEMRKAFKNRKGIPECCRYCSESQ